MSVKSYARIIGSAVTLLVAIGLYFFDHELARDFWWFIGISAGAVVVAFLITPYITVNPYRWMRETTVSDLIAAVIGLMLDLLSRCSYSFPWPTCLPPSDASCHWWAPSSSASWA